MTVPSEIASEVLGTVVVVTVTGEIDSTNAYRLRSSVGAALERAGSAMRGACRSDAFANGRVTVVDSSTSRDDGVIFTPRPYFKLSARG